MLAGKQGFASSTMHVVDSEVSGEVTEKWNPTYPTYPMMKHW
jgi:hypothetical protein